MHELDHYIFLKMLLENLKFTKDAVATQSSKFLVVDEIALYILCIRHSSCFYFFFDFGK